MNGRTLAAFLAASAVLLIVIVTLGVGQPAATPTSACACQQNFPNWAVHLNKALERKVFSQYGQDGILNYIFSNIGTTNKYYVEFGFDSDSFETGGGGPNTALLHIRYGWKGLLLDGRHENSTINLHQEFITADNIVQLFDKYNVPAEPDYVSIDIDSADIWVLRAIISSGKYRPRVLTAEYNSNLPLHSTLTWPREHVGTWTDGTRFYGSGLGAFRAVAKEAGYSIVWVLPHDVFFVRNDLLKGVTEVHPFTRFKGCSGVPIHRPIQNQLARFEEYHTYVRTGSSTAAAAAAQQQMEEMRVDLST